MSQRLWPSHSKPPACQGCPRFRTGRGFVPGYGRPDVAPLVIVGEQPGSNEVIEGSPFVGRSGEELDVGLGSLGRDGTFITNVRKCLGPANESPADRSASIAHCTRAYLQQEFDACTEARTILVVGNDALEAVVGPTSIVKWHGSVVTSEERNSIMESRDAGD